ncbi:GAF domain-containing protein [Solirubrobacter pauli]|uniref:GAF domain-containing protein n=1 Tax=Solirubrobacter pauli TaxID=166793 RepID=A0A660L4I9_9ACTN|nr:GAF domain-containing protein [Solirubrobacter pauli]RKQ88235.1 GAF domain-containing protein [Solirubrobacter pauli]
MRATTVRFSDDLWALLEAEASNQGISAAQFVRDATIMRLGMLSAHRGDEHASLTLESLASGALAGRAPTTATLDAERLAELQRTGLLDTPPDATYDRIAGLAARLASAPVALISLVDADRQFFKSCVGLGEPWSTTRETPLSHSFCQHALDSDTPIVIEDARVHPLVRDNLAIRDLDVVAYLGIPLITAAGHTLGTLCVIDHKSRTWTPEQIDGLQVLTTSVVAEIQHTLGTGQ